MTNAPLPNEPVLLRSDADGVATLTLNRPNSFNTLSSELMTAVQTELDRLMTDEAISVVVLAGAGRAFCAGHDLTEMRADPGLEPMGALFTECSRMMTTLTKIPQPVIAKVHGVAAAAGCQLVAQCDLAICAEEAKFGTSGVNLGLFCSTPMVAVTRNMPRKQAMEMLMTGDLIDADMAERWGLVNRVVPTDQLNTAIDDLAGKIASKSRAAVGRGKKLFYTQIEEGLEAAYAEATQAITSNMQDNDARAGIDAFIDKQPMPTWKGK